MKWLHGLIVLGVMVSAARGQEGKEVPVGEANATPEVSKEPESGKDTDVKAKSESESIEATPPPDWVRDAIWYYVDVGRFRNGEPGNDPPDLPPWGQKRTKNIYDSAGNSYGGDFQGFRKELPYLTQLGVNALILDGVFPSARLANIEETLHVHDSLGVPSDMGSANGSMWSESDKLFLDVVEEAQKQGFRVVVQFPHPMATEHRKAGPLRFTDYSDFVWRMNERWLRTGDDSGNKRGIDGWADRSIFTGTDRIFRNWRTRLKKVNRDCVLVALNQLVLPSQRIVVERDVDAVVFSEPAESTIRFFQVNAKYSPSSLLQDLGATREKWCECVRFKHNGLGDWRLTNCLSFHIEEHGGAESVVAEKFLTPALVDRWRLAVVFQLLYSNDYAIPFGEEVGMIQEGPPWYPEPMWWNDLPNPESKRATYRGDFYALIQMLNTFRARFAPLRRGEFKPIIADDEKKLLAFARTMPGDEVILVMNYGDTKQSVSLTVGQPGELVPVLSPQLKPMPMPRKGQPAPPEPDLTKIPELRVGAQREFVKPNGTIDFWVDPMGVRIVLIGASARATMK